ncbi:hypothetical protein BSKO_02491 [Bryopsis sp. KO-2023]|nr:hypothetical protein BSKO_02491 [Bryopsis sp. KO-2023]
MMSKKIVLAFFLIALCAVSVSAGKKGGYDPVYVVATKKVWTPPPPNKKTIVIVDPPPPPPEKKVVVFGKKG